MLRHFVEQAPKAKHRLAFCKNPKCACCQLAELPLPTLCSGKTDQGSLTHPWLSRCVWCCAVQLATAW